MWTLMFLIKFGSFWPLFPHIFFLPISVSPFLLRLPLCIYWYRWWYLPMFMRLCLFFFILLTFVPQTRSTSLTYLQLSSLFLFPACSNLLLSVSNEIFISIIVLFFFFYCTFQIQNLFEFLKSNSYISLIISIWPDNLILSFSSLDIVSFSSLNIFKLTHLKYLFNNKWPPQDQFILSAFVLLHGHTF